MTPRDGNRPVSGVFGFQAPGPTGEPTIERTQTKAEEAAGLHGALEAVLERLERLGEKP